MLCSAQDGTSLKDGAWMMDLDDGNVADGTSADEILLGDPQMM
jgi:hypothetical protein